MVNLKTGNIAPDFNLLDSNKKKISLSDFRGKYVVLYFYPKDNTPGCTTEAIGFTEILPEFQKLDAEILGISPDSPESHAKFIEERNLKVTLLSDPTLEVLKEYGVWGKKTFRGKEYIGVIRSTFLIGPEGKIVHIWPKVRVRGHPDDVKITLTKLKALA